jgi:hypothetical protein
MFFGWVKNFSIFFLKLILIEVIFLISSMTVSHALLFADTDESFQAVLSLLDKDAFSEQKQITEYPILTALARNQNPSENLLNTLKSYIKNLPNDFAYLNKLYLIYSALVKTHCSKNKCSSSQLVYLKYIKILLLKLKINITTG